MTVIAMPTTRTVSTDWMSDLEAYLGSIVRQDAANCLATTTLRLTDPKGQYQVDAPISVSRIIDKQPTKRNYTFEALIESPALAYEPWLIELIGTTVIVVANFVQKEVVVINEDAVSDDELSEAL